MNTPLVSIIMPCYNAEKFLTKALDSVLSQTYRNWELLIVDDLSTDASPGIIRQYTEREHRIKSFRLAEKGFADGARNFALDRAEGEYVAFLDADDLWMKDKLEKQVRYMRANGYAFTLTDYYMMNANGRIFTNPYRNPEITTYRSLLLKRSAIHFSSVIFDFKKLGKVYFQKQEPEDFMFCLELLKRTPKAMNMSELLSVYRIANPLSNSGRKGSYAVKTWKLYRSLDMGLLKTCYYFAHYAVRGVLRYWPYKENGPYMNDTSTLDLPESCKLGFASCNQEKAKGER